MSHATENPLQGPHLVLEIEQTPRAAPATGGRATIPPHFNALLVFLGLRLAHSTGWWGWWATRTYLWLMRLFLFGTYAYLMLVYLIWFAVTSSGSIFVALSECEGAISGPAPCLRPLAQVVTPVCLGCCGLLCYVWLLTISADPLAFARTHLHHVHKKIDHFSLRCLLWWFCPGITFAILWPYFGQRELQEAYDAGAITQEEYDGGLMRSTLLSFGCFLALLPISAFCVVIYAEVTRLRLTLADFLVLANPVRQDVTRWLEAYQDMAEEWEHTAGRLGGIMGMYAATLAITLVSCLLQAFFAGNNTASIAVLLPLVGVLFPPFGLLLGCLARANVHAEDVQARVTTLVSRPEVPLPDAWRIVTVTDRRELGLTLLGRRVTPMDLPSAIVALTCAQLAAWFGLG